MKSTTALYKLQFTESKTYLWASAFVMGNILLPQLCHLIPQGGFIFLPIYFFTLIGAWKFGWRVGLLTAVFSPLVNSALFGMPMPAVVPIILVKSVLLALAAAFVAGRTRQATLPLILAVVAFYQIVGGLAEWMMTGSLAAAMQDIRIGMPGIVLQIVGCWFILNKLFRK
mgnify:CR=1 FL=1|jgi:hypothetical protein